MSRKKSIKQKQSQKQAQSVVVNIGARTSRKRRSTSKKTTSSISRMPYIDSTPRFYNTFANGLSESMINGRTLDQLVDRMSIVTLQAAREGAKTTAQAIATMPMRPITVREELAQMETPSSAMPANGGGIDPNAATAGTGMPQRQSLFSNTESRDSEDFDHNTPARVTRLQCPQCERTFKSKKTLDDHTSKYHPSGSSSRGWR